MNPIETVFSIWQNAVLERFPKTINELQEIAVEEWNKIKMKTIQKTIQKLNSKLKWIIENKGEMWMPE
jgi:hypothetical protein